MVVCRKVQIPMQKKQALSIVAVKLADWIPARDAKLLTNINGVKSTSMICRAKYQLFHQWFGTSSIPMVTSMLDSGCSSKMGCSG